MVITSFHKNFRDIFYKIKDESFKKKVKKQIKKIIESPEVGKPMKHDRKGTREVYVSPFRLSYSYIKEENRIIFLDLYHKDEQ
jgi:mRNA-degrading endonuclease RelE of RelBE toxin-antitoxin system